MSFDPSEKFRCAPLSWSPTRGQCATQYAASNAARANARLRERACFQCPAGACHVAGRLPDATTTQGTPRREPPQAKRRSVREALRFSFGGRELSIAELAAEAGCTWRAMYQRLRLYKMSPEEAVALGSEGRLGRRPRPPIAADTKRAAELLVGAGFEVEGTIEGRGGFTIRVRRAA